MSILKKSNFMRKKSVDRIVGLSALIISFLTLLMFIYQTREIHKQSRLSVMPRLAFHVKTSRVDSIYTYNLELKNKGIGPAIVDYSKIIFNQKDYPLNVSNFFENEFPKLDKLGSLITVSSISKGTTLSADETLTLYSYEYSDRNKNKILDYLNVNEFGEIPVDFKIVYDSVYEEKWKISFKEDDIPKKL